MFPALICTHSLQTSKCLLSVNIFIRSPPSPPAPLPSRLRAQQMPGDPSDSEPAGMVWGKGTSRSQRAAGSCARQPPGTRLPAAGSSLGACFHRNGQARDWRPWERYPRRLLCKWSLRGPPLACPAWARGLPWKGPGGWGSARVQGIPGTPRNTLEPEAPRVGDDTLPGAFVNAPHPPPPLPISCLPPRDPQQRSRGSFSHRARQPGRGHGANSESPSGPRSEDAPSHAGQPLVPIQKNPLIKHPSAPRSPVPCRSRCTLPLRFAANLVLCMSHD